MKRTMTITDYEKVTTHIRQRAFEARDDFDRYVTKHADLNNKYMELMDKYRSIPDETTRNSMVEWLQNSKETGVPVWFVEEMTSKVNVLNFWRAEEAKWECDEESIQRRNGKPPHWVIQIDDSHSLNVHHDPRIAKRTSVQVNRPKLYTP
jgi:hypothetical protein